MMIGRMVLAALCIAALVGCADHTGQATQPLSYNWDIRPILSDNCFRCHGPDAAARKAELRLDLVESATGELPKLKGKFAIVPGDPNSSELIRRISSTDPDVVMPPPSIGKSLTVEQAQTITRWIKDGAKYQPHWAYVAPEKVKPPSSTADGRVVNDIDRFIFARLEQEGLAPSPEADRATLINRVTLDLTGLPPGLKEVQDFAADDDPKAYERLVDRLLSSTAHAEHMTAEWLDIARYADTDGYLEDAGGRLLYPWRDWVISAYQNNMPFDKFSTLQIAGDLLPNPTRDMLLPTMFMRLGQRSSENGIIEEEYLNEYAVDRVETIGVGYLGQTVGCARCHDHKYDPISIKDFYSMAAFFSSTNEPGFASPGSYSPAVEFGPTLLLPDDKTQLNLDKLAKDVDAKRALLAEATERAVASAPEKLQALRAQSDRSSQLAQAVKAATAAYYPFDEVYKGGKGSLDFVGKIAGGFGGESRALGLDEPKVMLTPSGIKGQVPGLIQSPKLGKGVSGSALYLDDENKGYFAGDVGDYDRADAFSIDFWLYVGGVYEDATILNHNQHLRFARTGYSLDFRKNALVFSMVHSPSNMFSVSSTETLKKGEWAHLTVVYDGSSRAEGLAIYKDGKPLELKIAQNNLSQTVLTTPLVSIGDALYGLAFGKRFQQYTIAGSALDEVRVFGRQLTPLEVRYLNKPDVSDVGDDELRDFVVATDAGVLAAKRDLSKAFGAWDKIYSYVPEVMVMGDDALERPAYVKLRGVYSSNGDRVTPQGLDRVFHWDEKLPRNRLGLTQWLFDPKHPLTSRVYVNRLWQSLFGTGIVETAEDFGTQGSVPTHPRLLDWLAVEFVESGWDVRHMQKLMVMSATYRQASSISDRAREVDPFNHLLSRGVRQRFPAEVIRDNALVTAGLLDSAVGGRSVYPYQPARTWSIASGFRDAPDTYPTPQSVPASEHHRRSMYTYVKRAVQHPSMQVFDFSRRTTTVARRRTSNTPLQALALLNDPQYLEAYEGMASEVMAKDLGAQGRVHELYRLALRREPSDAEATVLLTQYNDLLARFAGDPEKAQQYVSAGVTPFNVDKSHVGEFAALASLARIVMNTPDVYSKR